MQASTCTMYCTSQYIYLLLYSTSTSTTLYICTMYTAQPYLSIYLSIDWLIIKGLERGLWHAIQPQSMHLKLQWYFFIH